MEKRIFKIAAGLGFLWYAVLRGAQALVIILKGVAFSAIDIAQLTADVTLRFQISNPLMVGLRLKGIVGDIYLDGTKIGEVNHSYDYYMSGWHTHIIPVTATISGSDVLNSFLVTLQTGDVDDFKNRTLAFDGKVLIGNYNVGVPVQITKNLNELL